MAIDYLPEKYITEHKNLKVNSMYRLRLNSKTFRNKINVLNIS